ncbi:MAG: co-chaperone GroES family protein [archaeon]|nr:co-chaperone GroES family protein [archaeon]
MNDIVSFIPLANRCLIQKVLTPEVTKGGIYLSKRLMEENSKIGKVIAVGQGEYNEKGNLIKTLVKKGDIVLLPDFPGTKINMADKKHEYQLYRDSELLGIIKEYKH